MRRPRCRKQRPECSSCRDSRSQAAPRIQTNSRRSAAIQACTLTGCLTGSHYHEMGSRSGCHDRCHGVGCRRARVFRVAGSHVRGRCRLRRVRRQYGVDFRIAIDTSFLTRMGGWTRLCPATFERRRQNSGPPFPDARPTGDGPCYLNSISALAAQRDLWLTQHRGKEALHRFAGDDLLDDSVVSVVPVREDNETRF